MPAIDSGPASGLSEHLPGEGTMLCNQLRTVARDRLERHAADLDGQQKRALDLAVAISLGLVVPTGVRAADNGVMF
jgi:mRNA-degrading endonuclease toxin of MazEF toxin-antitoxin module